MKHGAPHQAADTGFDRLEILTHTQPRVQAVSLDGEPVDLDQFAPQVLADRLVVGFPPLQGQADSFKQLEVVFETPVLRFGTEFNGWVFNSEDPVQIRQGIKPGNATFRFSGDSAGGADAGGGAVVSGRGACAPIPSRPTATGSTTSWG